MKAGGIAAVATTTSARRMTGKMTNPGGDERNDTRRNTSGGTNGRRDGLVMTMTVIAMTPVGDMAEVLILKGRLRRTIATKVVGTGIKIGIATDTGDAISGWTAMTKMTMVRS